MGTEHFWKSCKKQARRQDEAAALKAYRIFLVFLLCNIHTPTKKYSYTNWVLQERNMSFDCKFSQLQYYQILLKSVNIWPSNQCSSYVLQWIAIFQQLKKLPTTNQLLLHSNYFRTTTVTTGNPHFVLLFRGQTKFLWIISHIHRLFRSPLF